MAFAFRDVDLSCLGLACCVPPLGWRQATLKMPEGCLPTYLIISCWLFIAVLSVS
ncbi:hypothetical protein [Xenorhabdus bovienii]|uniref:hypothetical protein n=1 Tax=Xenorhabdus bovienii TaxID=40576 RepID=UPI0030DD21B5